MKIKETLKKYKWHLIYSALVITSYTFLILTRVESKAGMIFGDGHTYRIEWILSFYLLSPISMIATLILELQYSDIIQLILFPLNMVIFAMIKKIILKIKRK